MGMNTSLALLFALALSNLVAPGAPAPQAVVPTARESPLGGAPPQLAVRQSVRDIDAYGRRGCALVNGLRGQRRLHGLYYSGTLTQRAAAHSRWMYTHNSLTHQRLDALSFRVFDRRVGRYRIMHVSAENIAYSSGRLSDVAGYFHVQWTNSPPHLRNMLAAGHTHCGTGFAYDARSGRWWATQMFGRGDASFGNERNFVTPP